MQHSKGYIIGFIVAVAAVSALLLSVASQVLKEKQLLNIETDIKRNILIASGVLSEGLCTCTDEGEKKQDSTECCTVSCCYDDHIKAYTIDYEGNRITSERKPESINLEEELDLPRGKRLYPVFIRKEKEEVIDYIIPVVGKGLWSTLYGYLALEKDLDTIKGITFYKHGETPGLGAEIEKEWFLNNFIGKKIRDASGKLVSVTVVKGKVDLQSPRSIHEVDGISGATLTGNGVTKLIKSSLMLYEPYFTILRRKE